MYISVLQADIGLGTWLAVQWDDDLQSLMSNSQYRTGINRQFPKNGEASLGPKQLFDELGNGPTTAQVYKVVNVADFAYNVVPINAVSKKRELNWFSKKATRPTTASKSIAAKKSSSKSIKDARPKNSHTASSKLPTKKEAKEDPLKKGESD